MGSKRRVSEIERGAGLFMGLVTAMMDAARKKGVPFEAVHRLATMDGGGTVDKMIDLVHTDWRAKQPQLIDGQRPQASDRPRSRSVNGGAPFSAPVLYVQPGFEELNRRFPANVDPNYKGKRFNPIERCEAVPKESREVAFEYVYMKRYASTDEVLAEMDRKRLRPALYEELLGFGAGHPDEQHKYPIFALGSETRVRSRRRVAGLWSDGVGRKLLLRLIDRGWGGRCRFLAVREQGLSRCFL